MKYATRLRAFSAFGAHGSCSHRCGGWRARPAQARGHPARFTESSAKYSSCTAPQQGGGPRGLPPDFLRLGVSMDLLMSPFNLISPEPVTQSGFCHQPIRWERAGWCEILSRVVSLSPLSWLARLSSSPASLLRLRVPYDAGGWLGKTVSG